LPGLLAMTLLCLAVRYITWRDPKAGPPAERTSWRARLSAIKDVWAVAALFIIVMGGIYGGVFTATEGAGIGAFGAFCFAAFRRVLDLKTLLQILADSARTTAMLFMILVGALVFANFVNYTTMPADLKGFVSRYEISPITVMIAICAIYVILGTAMEELSMILLTVPVFFPLVVHLGFDPVWFGIIIIILMELAMITPPVGINLYVVQGLRKRGRIDDVIIGASPFVITMMIMVVILSIWPEIALWLPKLAAN
ncbi:MAG: TRAP transporter large permease subunit, partial [Microvirga sp.]